ncbi:NlpC/P60 family protein [Laspinema palackyanum]|uniref:C40 family peptidase n=1 Tax=Laspinema palackyanum TaxID=3231601 RepID=UPI00345CD22F|nr:C40 family peptidase [Laspinema sp. D2c]
MVLVSQLQFNLASKGSDAPQYRCRVDLNLYDSPQCEALATQASEGRLLRIVLPPTEGAVGVKLCEDDYPGWLALTDLENLDLAESPYQAIALDRTHIEPQIPAIIAFTHQAMSVPNEYLWGGTVAPNYDCSGLMQAAFRVAEVWLPRDAYQQEAFTQPIPLDELQAGDLLFFGTPEKATHVGLYLGEGRYIHSSGKKVGRNGIGIDVLGENSDDPVSRNYYQQLRGAGRVLRSYLPQDSET